MAQQESHLRQVQHPPKWLSTLAIYTTREAYWDTLFLIGLFAVECLACYAIIRFVPYTEIDWHAYMEQVTTFVGGERDYMNIRGGTGPLVYPAGFLYLFTPLQRMCYKDYVNQVDDVTAIQTAQYIFAVLYLATQLVVWYGIYQPAIVMIRLTQSPTSQSSDTTATTTTNAKATMTSANMAWSIWSWRIAMACTCLSKRVHSIFVLRLFNDGPTMLLFYASLLLFRHRYWNIGCFVFSLAVSIKMNVLLFAPGLLLLLIQASILQYAPSAPSSTIVPWYRQAAVLTQVVYRLFVYCALPQLILGAPFLLSHPVHYLRKAFELDRVFFYKWTVNWKFLPEDVFVAKPLSILLLLLHLSGLAYFCRNWLAAWRDECNKQQQQPSTSPTRRQLSPVYIVATLLVSNYVGICFARTLHYQFYAWYFHSLPFLLWYGGLSATRPSSSYPVLLRLVILLAIEWAFLTFPATPTSSAMLQVAQLAILVQIRPPNPFVDVAASAMPSLPKKKD